MSSPKKSEEKVAQKENREEKRIRRKQKATIEIIIEILKSERTLFKTERQMEDIFKRKIRRKIRELRIAEGFSPEETNFIEQIALAISQRDKRLFNGICHRLRARLTALGGFSKRLNKLIKNVNSVLSIFPELDEKLKEIGKDTKVISKEVRLAEKRLNNKGESLIEESDKKYQELKLKKSK